MVFFIFKKHDSKDRIESAGIDFFNKVRAGYLEIASDNKDRFIVIDANSDIDSIHNNIISSLNL